MPAADVLKFIARRFKVPEVRPLAGAAIPSGSAGVG
jgi:hypothetical protein